MAVAVVGLRGVFSLPVALQANWMLRVTQQQPASVYLGSARRILLLLGVLPVWLWAAAFSFPFRPWMPVAGHLVILALLGVCVVELSLAGFRKVPFTCSYLPDKSNIQVVFWGLFAIFVLLSVLVHLIERPSLGDPAKFLLLASVLALAAVGTRLWNRSQEERAELYYEEVPEPPLVTLNLTLDPRSGRVDGA
jgi:hypothetical protein